MFEPAVFKNWIDDFDILAQRARPRSVSELRDIVQFAVAQQRRLRAVGSGHSMSSAAKPRDIFVDLSELTGAHAEVGWTKPFPPGLQAGEHMIRVQAGTKIRQLNRLILPEQKPQPLGLINMGAFDGQTLAGAISTSTHGTGVRLGSLADQVLSVELVAGERVHGVPRVGLYRIEPTDGITDPTSFAAAASQHNMTLIQDDDLFYAVVVSYGCMGIAVAYTLKTVPEYWLKEETVLVNWPDLRTNLRTRTTILEDNLGRVPHFVANDRHLYALINIAEMQGRNATEDAACLVYRRNLTPEEPQPPLWIHRWPPERRKTLLRQFVMHNFPKKPHKEHDDLGKTLRRRFFENENKHEPFMEGRTASVSYIAHRRERDRVRDEEADPDPPPDALSCEFAVRSIDVATALDVVISEVKKSPFFFIVPLGVRFVAPSKHFLAPTFDRASAYIEVPFNLTRGRAGGETMSREETRELIAKPALAAVEKALR